MLPTVNIKPITQFDLAVVRAYEKRALQCVHGATGSNRPEHKSGAMLAIDHWFACVDQVRELYYGQTPGY